MRSHVSCLAWLAAPALVLWLMLVANPPGSVSWQAFFDDPTSASTKLWYLSRVYLAPAGLSFAGIVLFQLQFRMSMSGARAAAVFSTGVLGAAALLGGFRMLALAPNSLPGYVVGMALGYAVMARLYAVRMRTLWGKLRMPVPVWRGDGASVRQVDRQAAARMK